MRRASLRAPTLKAVPTSTTVIEHEPSDYLARTNKCKVCGGWVPIEAQQRADRNPSWQDLCSASCKYKWSSSFVLIE